MADICETLRGAVALFKGTRARLPLGRSSLLRLIPPEGPPALRYGIAVLCSAIAVSLTLLSSAVIETRLVVFAAAVMVSAWFGGWKPGLAATAFCALGDAYFFLQESTLAAFKNTALHLALFIVTAVLICWFNAVLRSAQQALGRSEANFRSLVVNAPYGICRCSIDGQIMEANPALVSMMGFTLMEDLLHRNLIKDLYRDHEQRAHLAECFRARTKFDGVQAEWKRNDGTFIVVQLSGRPIQEEHNNDSVELYAEDVTERRALEIQFRHAQKMEAVGRLAGGIAHDFNNLLMVISGYCEFLLERLPPDASLRGPAQEIASAAERATSLTRQLLAFSRKQLLAPKLLDLNRVISGNLKMLPRLIGEDVELVTLLEPSLSKVKADPGQIEQVIMNLVVNARDAMPAGGSLTIETQNVILDEAYCRSHPAVAPGEYVLLVISDTGMGMDPEIQSHIFEPFFTTKGQQGTGFGLSTAYGIVKQSGGYIWVYSEPDHGTTFKIYLPRAAHTEEQVQRETEHRLAPQGRETILVVEDEPKLRALSREFLERQGYTVLEAESGMAAMELFTCYKSPIDLLLTDVVMPGINGPELAQRLLAMRSDLLVLYMSGYTENALFRNGTLEQGTMLLQKPFSAQTLNHKVRELLENRRPPAALATMDQT